MSQRINLGYTWNDSPSSDIHKIPKYNTKRTPRCFDELVIPLHVARTHLPAL